MIDMLPLRRHFQQRQNLDFWLRIQAKVIIDKSALCYHIPSVLQDLSDFLFLLKIAEEMSPFLFFLCCTAISKFNIPSI